MKTSSLTLCEFATVHADGTFTIVRGGIDWFKEPPPGQGISGFVFGRIQHESSESGSHQLRLRVINEDGRAVVPDLEPTITMPNQKGALNLSIGFENMPLRAGRYEIHVVIDRHLIGSLPFSVRETPKDKTVPDAKT